jgi:hypothetical protein
MISLQMARPLAATLLGLASLAGCSTYRSPDLPPGGDAKIAILEVSNAAFNEFPITKIDGQSRGVGWISRYELSPGEHDVTALPNGAYYRGAELTRTFLAHAGKHYRMAAEGDLAHHRWNFHIEETPDQAPAPATPASQAH